eukprot:gnl/MRDRNA2_/MRDRNA2_116629_c0_seq1.p1 gnl/MRDRNA2_/MRDRNA2_116629_c0~~gnl/MRDRNA2_/MRDRNA2_116629_c0_seq1.p1  ORF type:complete len:741 (+),score=227.82 gnl/MRDRNA2_/MRDRNA2_116629_c0_seq1:116-2338(+)
MANCPAVGSLCKLILCFVVGIHAAEMRSRSQERFNARMRQGQRMESKAQAQQRLRVQQRMEAAVASGLEDVIDLLGQVLADFGTQELEDKKLWEEYSAWSETSEKEKRDFIQEQNALVMSEMAKKKANEQMVATLSEELVTLANEIKQTKMGVEELIQMRKQQQQAFQDRQAGLTETIQAVVKAIDILEGHHAVDNTQLMQIKQRVQMALSIYGPARIKSATRENLMAFATLLQVRHGESYFLTSYVSKMDNDERQGTASGVIRMLGDLQSDLQSQLQTAIAQESENRRQYEQTKVAKETDLQHQEDTLAKKQQEKVNAQAIIETCTSATDQAKTYIFDAEKFLQQLVIDREKFQKEFAERNSVRSDERAATQAALDILATVHARTKKPEGTFFLQTSLQSSKGRIHHVANDLAHIGNKLESVSLIQLGSQMYTMHQLANQMFAKYDAMDPAAQFNPVVKLLTELISKLEEEAAQETSQHEWCETEKTTSVTAKEEREASLTELKTKINEESTLIATLKTEIIFMESEIARVTKETEDSKVLRKEQHDAYVLAKADHEEVIKAIGLALEALGSQFGGGASFIQVEASQNQAVDQQPGQETVFKDNSSGKLGAGSAIGMLEDLQKRYADALQEIKQTEADQQKAYDELLVTNEQFIADTTNSKNMKLKQRRAKLGQLGDAKGEMRTSLLELHQVNKYLQNLRPSCDDIRTTYEERKQRREAEIAALKEALQVISDPSMMSG